MRDPAVRRPGAGCGAGTPPPAGPPAYKIMVTEPSGNIGDGDGQLYVHWSCDPTVDPSTRYKGTQNPLRTDVDGVKGQAVLRADATCPAGALLTAQVDAAVRAPDYNPTRLRCQVFAGEGREVAKEEVTRGLGSDDPVCRVQVP